VLLKKTKLPHNPLRQVKLNSPHAYQRATHIPKISFRRATPVKLEGSVTERIFTTIWLPFHLKRAIIKYMKILQTGHERVREYIFLPAQGQGCQTRWCMLDTLIVGQK
jgi:hypothetical protein